MRIIYICIFFQLIFTQDVVYFDGNSAMEHLNYQCSFGPRFVGGEAHDQFADSLKFFLDHILLLFPFEKKYFDEEDIKSTFTGHPLLEESKKK